MNEDKVVKNCIKCGCHVVDLHVKQPESATGFYCFECFITFHEENKYIVRLQNKLDDMKKNGLVSINVIGGDMTGATVESVAKELLESIEAIERGEYTPLRFNDSRKRGD